MDRVDRKRRRKFGIIIKLIFLMLLLIGFLLGFLLYFRYGRRILKMEAEARKIVAKSTKDTFRQAEASVIYDADGGVIARLKGEKDTYYLKYAELPKEAVEAIISIEDKKFYEHKGFDLKAILRATLAYIKNKGVITQGGSTITQQLARNIFLSFEESFDRKAKEVFIARELEKKYSKNEIMEFYLNNIYFANGYYGIQSASYGYFGKGVNSLSLSQIAFLLAIPNSPKRYDPYVNIEGALGRRDRILEQMKRDGKLSEKKYEKAIQEKIKMKEKKKLKTNAMESFAKDQAVKALMRANGFLFQYDFSGREEEENYEEEYANAYATYQGALYSEGYQIYTSLEPKKQRLLQKSVDEALKVSKEKSKAGVYELQGSAVCIDNENGRVVAVVGGRSQGFSGSVLNRAYQSHRQPGSTIKPLIVYTPAFEMDYTPETIVKDEKIEKGPVNADGVYSGKMTITDAVARSKNTVAYRLFLQISPAKGIEKLLRMRFSSIEEEDYYPAAALGGMSRGVSALELASAYAALANKGVFREASCILKIEAPDGGLVLGEGYHEVFGEERIYTEEASKMMTACLINVMKNGTGRRGRLSTMPCAGKTGTTNDTKDLWFAGYTKYYTTAIWVGYDLPRSLISLPYGINPLSIWKTYMEEVHKGLELKKLDVYVPPKKSLTEEKMEEIEEEEEEEEEEELRTEEEPVENEIFPETEETEGEDSSLEGEEEAEINEETEEELPSEVEEVEPETVEEENLETEAEEVLP